MGLIRGVSDYDELCADDTLWQLVTDADNYYCNECQSCLLYTSIFPASLRIIILKTIVMTPDDISATKEETQTWQEYKSLLTDGTVGLSFTEHLSEPVSYTHLDVYKRQEMGKENHVFCPAFLPQEMDELVEICDHIVFNSVSQYLLCLLYTSLCRN